MQHPSRVTRGGGSAEEQRPTTVPQQHRVEELQIQIATAHEVNAHLNQEVERLTLRVEALEGERQAYERHIKSLAKQLAAARCQPSQQHQQQRQQNSEVEQHGEHAAEPPHTHGSPDAVQAAAGGTDVVQNGVSSSSSAADAAAEPPPSSLSRGGSSSASSWHAQVDWERLRQQGREQGWLVTSDEIFLGDKIGQGTFGSVYRSVVRGGVVAVKCVQPKTADEGVNFLREVEALAMVRHPNVMALYGACMEPPDRCWLVCEYLPGGTLSRWLYGDANARRPPARALSERLRMALEVARGMQALEEHEPQVLHRDLKPSNVFLDATGHAKVADFGLSRILEPSAMACLTGETGSYLWMSPECIRHEVYNSRSDVWSWGVMCVELLTQQRPYANYYATPVQLALQVGEGQLMPEIPADCHPLLGEMLLAAFDPDPLNRPSFGLIVSKLSRVVEDVAGAEAAAAQDGGSWSRWFKQRQA